VHTQLRARHYKFGEQLCVLPSDVIAFVVRVKRAAADSWCVACVTCLCDHVVAVPRTQGIGGLPQRGAAAGHGRAPHQRTALAAGAVVHTFDAHTPA
jgi:hypothetical protein